MSSGPKPVTVPEVRAARATGRRLVMVTAYDATAARLVDAAGVDLILVGDSLGMVVQGRKTPLAVTMAQMRYHTACVARGTARALVVADLPFLSYQVSPRQAVRNAGRLLQAGAAAVKLEGGTRMAAQVAACARADIPVVGHVGLTPQSVHRLGGFKVQRDADAVVADAQAVEAAGAFALVVEAVPVGVMAAVQAAVSIPTIGIGAGPGCDGQVLVFHDLLGLFEEFRPRFVKRYAELGEAVRAAVRQFGDEVRAGTFPAPEQSFP